MFRVSAARIAQILEIGERKVRSEFGELAQGATGPDQEPKIAVVTAALLEELTRQPHDLHLVSPRRFEELVAFVFEQLGFSVELTRPSADGGKDVIAVRGDELGIETSYIVECKRYAPTNRVGVAVARAIYGVKEANSHDHAIVATTSTFTRGAVDFAAQPGVTNLHLRDFDDICAWIREAAGAPLPMKNSFQEKQGTEH